jgi:hypothetical protein
MSDIGSALLVAAIVVLAVALNLAMMGPPGRPRIRRRRPGEHPYARHLARRGTPNAPTPRR